MVSFLAGVVGAVVGGIATFFAAMLVMRRERVRVHRERICSELLPRLEDVMTPSKFPQAHDAATALERVAVISSKGDREQVTVVGLLARETDALWRQAENAREPEREAELSVKFRAKFGEATDAIESYDAWLRKKLRVPAP